MAAPNGAENTSNFNDAIGEHRSSDGLMGRINLSSVGGPVVDRLWGGRRWDREAAEERDGTEARFQC